MALEMLRGPKLKGELKQEALEQLATIPEPWLERLAEERVAYVALGYGEDLSQTDLLWSYTPESIRSEAIQGGAIVTEVSEEFEQDMAREVEGLDDFQAIMLERERPSLFAEKLSEKLLAHGVASTVKVIRDLLPLPHLEQEFGIEPSDSQDGLSADGSEQRLFREALLELNGGQLEDVSGSDTLGDESVLKAKNGVLLVPFGSYGGRLLSPQSKESYAQINGAAMDQHYGAHYWDPRIIALDDDVVALPSKKTGHHSVLLHETGHAMDYIAEKLEAVEHRKTVDSLYESALERAKSGDSPFLTPRARDNVREYFAEAVEAYFTTEIGDKADFYKRENNRQQLQLRDPELFAYLDHLMQL